MDRRGGDGRYAVLEVETRVWDPAFMTEPDCHYTTTISPFKERIRLDKIDRHLHDEITVIDHALTRPWTVDKICCNANPLSDWPESICVR